MNGKKYVISSLSLLLIIILAIGSFVYYIDPYSFFHGERNDFPYVMETNDFMYYNPGIAKNYDYDTAITGSSMSRAMRPSYIDEKLNCKSVKLSMAEARGKDFSTLLPVVFRNENLKRVIIGLDTFAFDVDKEYSTYEKPEYMYDNNPFNDIKYLINYDSVLRSLKVLNGKRSGEESTSRDDYQNYTLENEFSAEQVKNIYRQSLPVVCTEPIDKTEYEEIIKENLEANIIPFITEHPDVQFDFYFPPYSIVKWGLQGNCDDLLNKMRILAENLIDYDNVSLYFTQGEQNIITDLDHYMDTIHFDTYVADCMTGYISNPENKMNKYTYMEEIDEFEKFIREYDYSVLL